MKVIHHYGLNSDDKKAILSELAKPDCAGRLYDHIVDIPVIGTDYVDHIHAEIYIDASVEDEELSIDETLHKYDIQVRIDNLGIFITIELLKEYAFGIRWVKTRNSTLSKTRFSLFIDEQCPLYYDILTTYMIERGHDWKWGELGKSCIEYV